MAAATWAIEIDFDKNGTYDDYTADLDGIGNGLDVDNGAASGDGGFRSGTMSFSLRNHGGAWNRNYSSGSVYGLMNERVPARIRVTRSGTTTFFGGYITEYDGPVYEAVGAEDASWITFRADGLLSVLADDEVTVAASSSYDVDGALAAVFTNLGLTVTTDYVVTDSDQAIALFFADREPAGQVIKDLVASDMGGVIYEKKTGVIQFTPRDGLLHGTADATWGDDNAASPKVFPSRIRPIVRDRMADTVDVITRTVELGAGGTIVYQAKLGTQGPYGSTYLFKTITVPANQSLGPTVVSVNSKGVLGIQGVPASTAYLDYVANSASDGTGSDVTANVTVTFTLNASGTAYSYTITNTSASVVYLTKFIVRAVPILDGSGTSPGTALLSAPTGANDTSVGSVAWSNPTNVTSTNNSYATAVLTGGQTSNYLLVNAFGAGVPSNATINGVAFEVECKAAVQTTQVISARIVKAGTVETTVTRTVVVGTTEAYKILGASDDVWGTTLTPETVNNSGFGVALYFSAALADTYSVDHVKMTIYFETQVGVNKRAETWTAELAIPGVKGGQRRTYNLPWVSDSTKARDYAQQMLRIARYPEELLELTFPWKDDASRDAMIAAELYQLIAYQDTSVGPSRAAYVDDWYRVIGLSQRTTIGSAPETVALLKPSLNFRDLDNIAWDDFNRADGSLGKTPTGDTWVINDGAWEISSNKARPTSTALGVTTFDLGVSNFVAELSLSGLTADTSVIAGIVFRYASTLDSVRFTINRTGSNIWSIANVNGIPSTQASGAWTVTDTAELRIVVQGNRMRGWLDRKLVFDISNSHNSSDTKVGMYCDGRSTVELDNFYAQGL